MRQTLSELICSNLIESEILNETTPYGFEEFIDYNDGKYDVKPGALDEVREKLLGAALLLWYIIY